MPDKTAKIAQSEHEDMKKVTDKFNYHQRRMKSESRQQTLTSVRENVAAAYASFT